MEKPCIEFINACAWCDKYTSLVKELKEKYKGKIEVKIYRLGQDFDYIRKYGAVLKSLIIVNEKKKIEDLSKGKIEKAFEEALL